MAKKSKQNSKPRSENPLFGKTYSQMRNYTNKNPVSMEQLSDYYTKYRKSVMRQIQRIGKDVGWYGGRPEFRTVKELSNPYELLHEAAKISQFVNSKNYSIDAARERRDRTVNRLTSMGYEITPDNIRKFSEFMRWFYSSAYSEFFSSDSEETVEIFNSAQDNTKRRWKKLFEEQKAAGAG